MSIGQFSLNFSFAYAIIKISVMVWRNIVNIHNYTACIFFYLKYYHGFGFITICTSLNNSLPLVSALYFLHGCTFLGMESAGNLAAKSVAYENRNQRF